ncbi:Peptidase S8, subtilisin-related, partial [Klenkia terrae]
VAVPGASRAAVATGASLAVAAASVVVAVAAAGPAAAAQVCDQPPVADTVQAAVPWSQQAWDPAAQVWPFSTGAGVTVAVLDTGVQTSNPQLAGRVAGGVDLVSGGTADVDCVPHGSGLAGVVVAGQQAGVGLRGLAPDATVLPVQVAQAAVGEPGTTPVDPGVMAAGLDAAVAGGAQVVLVGPVVFRDDPQLADAVQRTLDAGVVVVAGVGDGHEADRDGEGPTAALATPYPAAYPGVLGVAAVGSDGLRADTSQIGDYVDLAAPGAEVVSTGTAAQQVYDGTAFAAAFVAAAAALVVAEPGLVPSGADRPAAVQARLAATAVPPPSPAGYGAGLLSPGRAVTEDLAAAPPRQDPGYQAPPVDEAAVAAARAAEDAADRSALWALAAGAVAVLAVLTALLLPRARRRRWRTGRAAPTAVEPEPAGHIPSAALFEPPR